jgi:hypothetical protein
LLISKYFACLSRSRISQSSVNRNYKAPRYTILSMLWLRHLTSFQISSSLYSKYPQAVVIPEVRVHISLWYKTTEKIQFLYVLVRARKDKIFWTH